MDHFLPLFIAVASIFFKISYIDFWIKTTSAMDIFSNLEILKWD